MMILCIQRLMWRFQIMVYKRILHKQDEMAREAAIMGFNHDPEIRFYIDRWYSKRRIILHRIEKLQERLSK